MASTEFPIKSDSDPQLRQFRTWTEVLVKVPSQANGETRIRYGRGDFVVIEPGETVRFLAAPQTNLEAKTTSSTVVTLAIFFTELDFIDQAFRVLCTGLGVRS